MTALKTAAPRVRSMKMPRVATMRRLASMRLFLVIASSVGAAACVRVAPYERETLARRDMALSHNGDLAAGEDHGRAYREGSSGGGEAKGGGCGCN